MRPNGNWHPWDTAPKDGPAIHVEFQDGTPALHKVGCHGKSWRPMEGPGRPGHWHEMEYQHGNSTPVRWRLAPRPKGVLAARLGRVIPAGLADRE